MHAFGVDPTNPADLDIVGSAIQLRNGALSSVELVDAFLARIEERNGGDPTFDGDENSINAWARVYPDRARQHATAADERIAREGPNAPFLCGVPIGLKDIVSVKDLPITASSRVLEGNIARESAAVWRDLEQAGVVLIGHNHTHEFAAGGTTDQVGNPWSLERTAGGSSGGSAAAVAGGMIAASIGTDSAGSVRNPASFCGVSAMKPSLGSVSLDGIIPRAFSLDHVGPIAHTLADCRALLSVMTLSKGHPQRWDRPVAFELERKKRDHQPLAGITVAITDRSDGSSTSPDTLDAVEIAVGVAVSLGATVKELKASADLPTDQLNVIMLAEALAYHLRFEEKQSLYRPSIRRYLSRSRSDISSAQYIRAQMARAKITGQWERWFHDNEVDVILEPTVTVDAPMRGSGYSEGPPRHRLIELTALWNLTGFPVATFPTHVGDRSGLPVSVSLIGSAGHDSRVLEIAETLQTHLGTLK